MIFISKISLHAPNVTKCDSERVRSSICDRAASTVEKPRQIVMQCTNASSAEAAVLIPKYTATQRTIECKRKRAEVPLPVPGSLADITIPDNLAVTSRNDNFVLWDSGDDDAHRMFVFKTDRNLELLEEHADWFMDRTFKIAPELFVQVFTVHALIDNRTEPLVYALTTSKVEADYVRLLQKVAELRPTL